MTSIVGKPNQRKDPLIYRIPLADAVRPQWAAKKAEHSSIKRKVWSYEGLKECCEP
jgi:hypothetical protein